MNTARLALAVGLGASLSMIGGCGLEATPQPPSLKLPSPVTNLSGVRSGDEVSLHWTMPKRDTDKEALKGDVRVRICRRVETGACDPAGDILAAPAATAEFTDHVPRELALGPAKLLVYTVVLQNRGGHDAGPSNAVYAMTGPAPTRPENFSATASAEGIVLKWDAKAAAESDGAILRIHRSVGGDPVAHDAKTRAATPGKDPASGSPPPPEQTLEVGAPDRGEAVDRDAALDHVYRYIAERVRMLTREGHSFEVASQPTDVVTLNARDVFPPRAPEDVQAVSDAEARAIDLSWTPNTEPDMAGYIVYRREVGAVSNPVRVSPPGTVAPSFRDASALPGHHYAYSVSAIDRDGNESGRSPDVEETLPQP